jgi:hypothetical protein
MSKAFGEVWWRRVFKISLQGFIDQGPSVQADLLSKVVQALFGSDGQHDSDGNFSSTSGPAAFTSLEHRDLFCFHQNQAIGYIKQMSIFIKDNHASADIGKCEYTPFSASSGLLLRRVPGTCLLSMCTNDSTG